MKKTILIISALMITGLMAQKTQAQNTSFGVRAGVNFQNINGQNAAGQNFSNKLKTGFNVGVNAEIPIAPEFYFQPGLLFSTKGAKIKTLSSDKDADLNLNYLELPLNLLYKAPLGTDKILLGFGPYVAYGLGGKYKVGSSSYDVKFKDKATTESNTTFYKPLDAGANLLVGYEFSNKVSAQLNAQLGLVNIDAYHAGAKQKNTGFGVSIGYRF